MTQPGTLTLSDRPLRLRTPSGLLPDARHVVLPDGITSTGAPRIVATCHSIGVHFDPWQLDACTAILALGMTGLYAADMVILSIARQVGKTFLVGAIVFADCIAHPGTLTVWTAHRFKVARESFDELRAIAESEALAPHIDKDAITTAAGNEIIPFRNGSRIVFAARERGSIRGFRKVRRLVLDEAQILSDAALSDLAPTQNQAVNPQIILMGTPPKPSDPSEAFTRLRAEALSGEGDGLCYIEFSADPGSSPDDMAQVAKANPSYPHRTPERAIARLRRLLDDDDFLREVMGIWTDEQNALRPIPHAGWLAQRDPSASIGRSPLFGLDVDIDRKASITAAWKRADGGVQVSLIEPEVDAFEAIGKCKALAAKWQGRVMVPRAFEAEATKAGLRVTVVKPAELNAASGALVDRVLAGTLWHDGDAALTDAALAARWATGSSADRSFDLRQGTVIRPLLAAVRALAGLTSDGPSVYEDRGLVSL